MKGLKAYIGAAFVALMTATSSYAATEGEIDFADLSKHYGEPKVEVNLTPNLMKMVGAFAKSDDPEVAEILSKLESVKVRIYNLDDDSKYAQASLAAQTKRLKADKWETLVTVNDNEENQNVRIFSKTSGDVIDGFVVMVVSPEKDGGEAVFINVVGEINPNQIAKITENFDIHIN